MTIYEIQEDRVNQLLIDNLPRMGLATLDELIHQCQVHPLPDDEASNRVMVALNQERVLRLNLYGR